MQKKIIALAVASALTVPAMAFAADVSVSGQFNMSYDMVNDGAASSNTTNQLTSNQSRVIVSGSEDMGGGMSTIFALDNRFNGDAGSASAMWSGNTYVGMKSDSMGTLKFGNMDTPFKSATRGLDVFYDVAGDNRVGVGSTGGLLTGHDVRLANSLIYTSPAMGALSVSVGTVFGAESATSATVNKGTDYSFAVAYNANGIFGTFAYDTAKAGDNNTGTMAANTAGNQFATAPAAAASGDESKAMRLGGGYSGQGLTVNAFIDMPKYTLSGVDVKNTNLYVGAKFAVSGTDFVRAAYTSKGETDVGGVKAGDKATQIAVGYSHDMSKATSVYATYFKTSADAGNDPSTISLGMKHSF